jgi:hypothetical protein
MEKKQLKKLAGIQENKIDLTQFMIAAIFRATDPECACGRADKMVEYLLSRYPDKGEVPKWATLIQTGEFQEAEVEVSNDPNWGFTIYIQIKSLDSGVIECESRPTAAS